MFDSFFTVFLHSEYGIPLPREELATVANLRDKWQELLVLAEKVDIIISESLQN